MWPYKACLITCFTHQGTQVQRPGHFLWVTQEVQHLWLSPLTCCSTASLLLRLEGGLGTWMWRGQCAHPPNQGPAWRGWHACPHHAWSYGVPVHPTLVLPGEGGVPVYTTPAVHLNVWPNTTRPLSSWLFGTLGYKLQEGSLISAQGISRWEGCGLGEWSGLGISG